MSTPLPRPFSVYLDLVRFLAACLVYLYHSNQRWLVQPILPFSDYGHSAVIVFFVLSGYVIAYVAHEKERDWASYAASRISRLYSVAVPAVALTLLLDWGGRHLLPEVNNYPFDAFALRILGSLLMANEVWFVSITSFSNVPYWSICYESWYYVAFGLCVYLPRRRAIWLCAALALVLGPKIALLAPVWAMGTLLFHLRRLAEIPQATGWLFALAGAAGIALFFLLGVEAAAGAWFESLLGKRLYTEFTFSRFFLGDYLLGALVTLHFAGMRRIAHQLARPILAIEVPVRKLAAYTFTLYLLHQPLFLFWGSVINGDNRGYGSWALATALMAVSVVVVGALTENQRHRLTARIRSRLLALASACQQRWRA